MPAAEWCQFGKSTLQTVDKEDLSDLIAKFVAQVLGFFHYQYRNFIICLSLFVLSVGSATIAATMNSG